MEISVKVTTETTIVLNDDERKVLRNILDKYKFDFLEKVPEDSFYGQQELVNEILYATQER